jgi:hypothetical protein
VPAHLFTAWHDKKVEDQHYVNGKWVHDSNRAHLGPSPEWQAGQKSELVFEHDGTIYCITDDQM